MMWNLLFIFLGLVLVAFIAVGYKMMRVFVPCFRVCFVFFCVGEHVCIAFMF